MLLRVDAATVIISSIILALLFLLPAILCWRDHQRPLAAAFFAGYFAGLHWMCGRTVELVPGKLRYRVFFRTRIIDVAALSAAAIIPRPAPTLELLPEGATEPVVAFVVKPFSKAGVTAILRHLQQCSPKVQLNPLARDMAAGNFDSITRAIIR